MENNKYQSNKHASNLHWNYFPCCCVWLFLLFCKDRKYIVFLTNMSSVVISPMMLSRR